MARDNTVFEREQLYSEVWKEPVRIVAKRYGISDVGLRKTCKKLGVPMPPLGVLGKARCWKEAPHRADAARLCRADALRQACPCGRTSARKGAPNGIVAG